MTDSEVTIAMHMSAQQANIPAAAQHGSEGMPRPAEIDRDRMRADLYALLATLLAAPPRADLLELIRQLEPVGPSQSELSIAWQLLSVAADTAAVEELDDEYHALFIGLGRGELVPFGSWYLTGYLMDRPLAWLRRDLEALGIERQEGVHDPEDHAAALCEAMRVIVAAGDIGHDRQQHFFETHMACWMPVFFKDMQQADAACFYVAVGRLGEAFLQFEERYLSLPE